MRTLVFAAAIWCLTTSNPGAYAVAHDTLSIGGISPDTLSHPRASQGHVSLCVQTCLDENSQQYDCTGDHSCYCEDTKASTAFESCMSSTCDLLEYLSGQRSYAQTCDIPARNRGDATRRLTWGMFVVATAFICGRCLSRTSSLGGSGFGWDDWNALLAYVFLIPTDITSELEVTYGLGRDMYRLSIANVVEVMKWFYFGELFYSITIALTKISLVMLYLRIWPADSVTRRFRLTCLVLVAALVAFMFSGIFVLIFQCDPINFVWMQFTGSAKGVCINIRALVYAHGILNVCFDVVVILLPVHVLMGMKFPNAKKAGLCAVFMVGFLVTICSLIRLQYAPRMDASKNISWNILPIAVFSLVEANFSVVVCCMPVLAGLLQRTWKKLFGAPARMGYSMVSGDEAFPRRTRGSAQGPSSPEMALEQWEHDAHRNREAAADKT